MATTTTFHPFTLAEVYAFASEHGYAPEDVTGERVCCEWSEDYEQELAWQYEVSFGHEYTEVWEWVFDDLDSVAVEYEHYEWED